MDSRQGTTHSPRSGSLIARLSSPERGIKGKQNNEKKTRQQNAAIPGNQSYRKAFSVKLYPFLCISASTLVITSAFSWQCWTMQISMSSWAAVSHFIGMVASSTDCSGEKSEALAGVAGVNLVRLSREV